MSEQEKEIRRLLEDIDKLQSIRDKQAVKLSALQDKIHSVDDEANRTLLSSDNAMRALSNEVRFLKSSLEQITEREHRVRILKFKKKILNNFILIILVTRFSFFNSTNARFRC